MRFVLEQLLNQEVTLNTSANMAGEYPNATITAVSTGLVTFTMGADEFTVSICHVAGVAAPSLRTVQLLQPPILPRTGECACCERPIRLFFDSIIGSTVDVLSEGTGQLSNIQNATVLRTGEGIVILDIAGATDVAALSLCKIISVSDVTPPP
jgi:hypothetical protein